MINDKLQALVNQQAEDRLLWEPATSVWYAYIQQELRNLHRAVEARVSAEPSQDMVDRVVDAVVLTDQRQNQ